MQSECGIKSTIDQDFRAILVITCRQRARHVTRPNQTVTETVPLCLVLDGVVKKILPQLGCQGVKRIWVRFKNVLQSRFYIGIPDIPEGKAFMHSQVLAEPNQHDPLTVLWDKTGAVNDFGIRRTAGIRVRHPVSELVKGRHDHFKSFTLVMALEVLDVLQHESDRLLCSDDPRNVKKQRALGIAFKSVFAAQRVLL